MFFRARSPAPNCRFVAATSGQPMTMPPPAAESFTIQVLDAGTHRDGWKVLLRLAFFLDCQRRRRGPIAGYLAACVLMAEGDAFMSFGSGMARTPRAPDVTPGERSLRDDGYRFVVPVDLPDSA